MCPLPWRRIDAQLPAGRHRRDVPDAPAGPGGLQPGPVGRSCRPGAHADVPGRAWRPCGVPVRPTGADVRPPAPTAPGARRCVRFQPQGLDTNLSLTNRSSAQKALTAELADRAGVLYDTSGWQAIQVPGSFNPPPDRNTTGGFYRTDFLVPEEWGNTNSLLKFGAVRYIADVWLNGHYLGYHEGGDTPFALDATGAS